MDLFERNDSAHYSSRLACRMKGDAIKNGTRFMIILRNINKIPWCNGYLFSGFEPSSWELSTLNNFWNDIQLVVCDYYKTASSSSLSRSFEEKTTFPSAALIQPRRWRVRFLLGLDRNDSPLSQFEASNPPTVVNSTGFCMHTRWANRWCDGRMC